MNENLAHSEGIRYLAEKNFDLASNHLKQAIDRQPQVGIIHFQLGVAEYNLEKFADALVSFSNAIELEPENGQFHYMEANSYLQLKKSEEAISSYRKALQLSSEGEQWCYWCYCNIGQALEQLNKPEKAKKAYVAAIKVDKLKYQAYHRLARTLEKLGDFEAAMVSQCKAIELDPNCQQGNQNLARIFARNLAAKIQPNLIVSWQQALELMDLNISQADNKIKTKNNNNNFNLLSENFVLFYKYFGEAISTKIQDKKIAIDKNLSKPRQSWFFDKTISLGSFCLAAHQIRRSLSQSEAYIFDWWVTSHKSLVKLIKEDFGSILRPENLEVRWAAKNLELVFDNYYGHCYNHDFPRQDNKNPDLVSYGGGSVIKHWQEHLAQVVEKYNFLVDRWRKTLSENRTILFVRVEYNWTPEKAIELRDLFAVSYPNIKSHFLFMGEASKPFDLRQDWKLENITTAYFPPHIPLNPPVPLPMGQIPPMDSGTEKLKEILLKCNSITHLSELPNHFI